MTDVVIAQHDDIAVAVADVLRHIPLAALVTDKRVAVKPNETYASSDDTTGITQPDTLRAVLRAVRAHSPRELIVTGGAEPYAACAT
jgi:uncharacterized protein (DUF362 family)